MLPGSHSTLFHWLQIRLRELGLPLESAVQVLREGVSGLHQLQVRGKGVDLILPSWAELHLEKGSSGMGVGRGGARREHM